MANYLHINTLTVQNFQSFANPVTLDFNEHSGTILVYGENNNISVSDESDDENEDIRNGVGKSALIQDAFLFGFFGKTGKNIKKTSIPNKSVGKDCKVTIDFHVNKNHYVVESGVNPTFCNLYENGKDITKSSIKLTYEYLSEHVLGTTYLIAKNTLFLSVTDSTTVLELSKSDKREFVENIFNVSIYGEIWQKVKDDANSLKKEINENESRLEQLNESIKQFREKKENYEKEKKGRLDEIDGQMKDIRKKRDELETDVSGYEDKLSELNTQYSDKEKEVEDLKEKKSKLENEKKLKGNENTTVNDLLKTYSDVVDVVCEDCYGRIDNLLDFEKNKQKLQDNRERIGKVDKALKKIKEQLETCQSELSSLKTNISKAETEKKNIESNIEKKKHFDSELERLNNEYEKVKNEKSEFDELIEKYTSDSDQVEKRLDEQKDDLKHINFLTFFFSEEAIKKYLISLLIGKLNERIRSYLAELGSDYTVSVDSEFNFTFYTLNGESEFGNFSGGEKRRIVVSTLFAIKDILNLQGSLDCNVASFDEILDVNIDNYALRKMVDIIKRENKICFITSQRELNMDDFDGVIKLSKYGNRTEIVYDSQTERE